MFIARGLFSCNALHSSSKNVFRPFNVFYGESQDCVQIADSITGSYVNEGGPTHEVVICRYYPPRETP